MIKIKSSTVIHKATIKVYRFWEKSICTKIRWCNPYSPFDLITVAWHLLSAILLCSLKYITTSRALPGGVTDEEIRARHLSPIALIVFPTLYSQRSLGPSDVGAHGIGTETYLEMIYRSIEWSIVSCFGKWLRYLFEITLVKAPAILYVFLTWAMLLIICVL